MNKTKIKETIKKGASCLNDNMESIAIGLGIAGAFILGYKYGIWKQSNYVVSLDKQAIYNVFGEEAVYMVRDEVVRLLGTK